MCKLFFWPVAENAVWCAFLEPFSEPCERLSVLSRAQIMQSRRQKALFFEPVVIRFSLDINLISSGLHALECKHLPGHPEAEEESHPEPIICIQEIIHDP